MENYLYIANYTPAMRVSHLSACLLAMIIVLAGCTGEKFPRPDIKDDFCGVHINYQYCKCAFHNEFCESIGMSKSEAKTHVNAAYDAWVDEKLIEWQTACAVGGGIPNGEKCDHKYGVVEHDGNLYLNSKPGEVLSIKSEDLPAWAQGQIATVGASIAVVGPPDSITEGDSNVLLNGLPVARVGDGTAHGGSIVEGSKNIFVNGRPVAIIGGMAVDPTVLPGPVPAVGGPISSNH